MKDPESIASRIKFDAEDRLPPAYWNRLRPSSVNDGASQMSNSCMDPVEWAQAPEFVPKHRRSLVNSFGFVNPMSNLPEDSSASFYNSNPINSVSVYSFPDTGSIQPVQPSFSTNYSVPLQSTNIRCVPFAPGSSTYDIVPKGYSANFTSINSGVGPPIAAIVLKKKRKRRPRKNVQKFDKNANEFTSQISRSDHASMSLEGDSQLNKHFASEQNLHNPNSASFDSLTQSETRADKRSRAYSCPHFSDEQLTIWDDILYNAIYDKNKDKLATKKSPKVEMSRRDDLQNNHKSLHDSFQTEKELIQPQLTSSKTASEKKNGSKEYEIKPFLYGNKPSSQWTVWDTRHGQANHEICNPDYNFDGKMEEDFYEGMRIQVNHFDTHFEDMTLSDDNETDKQSRFSQMQWAMRHENSCCTII